jgi:antitoxin HicB
MHQHAPEAERLLQLPYHIVLVRDGEGDKGWTARVQELPGCEAHEPTSEEAARAISNAMEAWLDAALKEGTEIPEPRRPSTHSGRLLLRMPQELHSEMARRAESEEVSLNVYITGVLAGTVGWPQGRDPEGTANGSSRGLAETAPPGRARFLSVAILTNIVVLVVVGIAAVVLLVNALQNGW